MKRRVFITFLFFVLFLMSPLYASEKSTVKPEKVLILPFKVFAKQDYAYLKDAVPEMLASRIFIPSKVEPIDPEKVKKIKDLKLPITQDKARESAKRFHARYVIWGSITVLGNSVSIDARLMMLKERL